MPLEKVEEVLSVLGYKAEDITDAETLKKKIESDWVPRNNVPSDVRKNITKGMAEGVLKSVRSMAKTHDISIENEEIEGKNIEDFVQLAWDRREEKVKAEIESLKSQIGKPDETISKLQKENEKLAAKLTAESTKTTKLFEDFETYKVQTETAKKQDKLNFQVSKAHSEKIKFKDGISELEKEGYFRKIEKNYKPELNDAGLLIALDASGNPIPGAAANSFKLYEQVLEEEGIKNNVWVINSHARNQNPNPIIPIATQTEQPAPFAKQRVIAKRIS